MKKTILIFNNPRLLAGLALVLWCASLALPGLVFHEGKDRILWGWQILLSGWLGLLMANPAWYANIFFFRVVFSTLAGGIPKKAALISVALALSAFFVQTIPVNEAGVERYVFGFGWGCMLWIVAVLLSAVAVGMLEREKTGSRSWLSLYSGLLAVCIVATTALAIYGRAMGNEMEKTRLAGAAFKRGKVCSVEVPVPAKRIKADKPIELIASRFRYDGRTNIYDAYPFNHLIYVLDWGVPIVRSGDFDYAFEEINGETVLTAKPAAGEISAKITAMKQLEDTGSSYLVEMTDIDGAKVFSYSADREGGKQGGSAQYCPDYDSFPSIDDQPRKLVMSALDIDDLAGRLEHTWFKTSTKTQWSREITAIEKVDGFSKTDCIADVSARQFVVDVHKRTGFLIGDKYFLPKNQALSSYFCVGDRIYLYRYYNEGRGIQVEERKVDNFSLISPGALELLVGDYSKKIKQDTSCLLEEMDLLNAEFDFSGDKRSLFASCAGQVYRIDWSISH